SHLPYLQQGLTIFGLGTPTFGKVIDAVSEIYGVFDRKIGDGKLHPLELSWNGQSILHVSNCLLALRREAPNMCSMPFANGINPCGILMAIVSDGEYVHGEDSIVQYFNSYTDKDHVR
ncbi:hypothetical protein AX17_006016, partial [Amanita inopinata Kibby_2008]